MQPPQPPPVPPAPGAPPPYGYPPARRTNGMAIASMVVSLASLVSCPLVGAVGIYLGHRAKTEIQTSGEDGEGFAQAGIIVGWVAIAITVLIACFFFSVFGLSFLPLFFV